MKRDEFAWVAFVPDSLVVGFAKLFGAGNFSYGPGTIGSMLGIPWFFLLAAIPWQPGFWIILLLSLYFSAAFCGRAAGILGMKDPGSVILDEFVAIPICFIGLREYVFSDVGWSVVLLGFGFFRLFDITKPWLIGCLDRIEGGWGILLDDVGAAIATCASLHILYSVCLPIFG